MEKVSLLQRITAYEAMIFFFLAVAVMFMILSANLYMKTMDPTAGRIFFTSLVLLIMGLVGWIAYNQLGEKIRYETLNRKYLMVAILIVLGSWWLGCTLFKLGIYESGLASTIAPDKLIQILSYLASLFLIMFAFIENLVFVVVVPQYILEVILKTPLEKATIGHYILAAIIAGVIAALAHVAWKPLPALINTFIYFTSWALSTLLIKNSIIADVVHMTGNALGLLYMTISPEYILW